MNLSRVQKEKIPAEEVVSHSKAMRRKLRLTALILFTMLLSGCGYSRAGKATRIPASVQTIAIPAFTNQTQTYGIEQTVTANVVREFLSRTKYHVTNHADGAEDATLLGSVVSAQLAPLTYDSQTGRASSGVVTVSLKVSLTDKQGKALFDNQNYVFRDTYQISREVSSFFREESPALDRLSRDVARTLVSDILENY